MSKRNEFALTLPSVLLVLGVVAILSASSSYLVRELVLLRGGAMHAYSAKILAQNDAIAALRSRPPDLTEALSITSTSSQVGAHTIRRDVASVYNLAPQSILTLPIIDGARIRASHTFPLFDYSELFSKLAPCSQTDQTSSSTTLSGLRLTNGASYNLFVCVSPRINEPETAFGANLYFPFELILEVGQTLSALGYFEAASLLILKGNATIFAAGDLYLKNITSDTGALRNLTLISSTGSINIENIAPQVRLKAIGKEGVYYPPSTSFQDGVIAPRLTVRYLLGFKN